MALTVRYITITQGNLNNNHFSLTKIIDIFPQDVIGGPNKSHTGQPVCIECGNETIATDIADKKIFRRRGWVRRFFEENCVKPGDQVCLEQLAPYQYRISKA